MAEKIVKQSAAFPENIFLNIPKIEAPRNTVGAVKWWMVIFGRAALLDLGNIAPAMTGVPVPCPTAERLSDAAQREYNGPRATHQSD